MHQHYEDILRRIPEPPLWFDDAGVPRFDPFQPNDLANIYAGEAALAEIACQACGRIFRVALTNAYADNHLSLADVIKLRRVRFGDPPNVGCCDAGPTMNSEMRMILEYWIRDHEVSFRWRRDSALEGPVDHSWGDGWLRYADAVAEILAAINGGATTVRVICPSAPRRYDLLGRLVGAAVARGARVLLAYPEEQIVMVSHAIKGHVAEADVGLWSKGLRVARAEFPNVPDVTGGPFDWLVLLAGVQPKHEKGRAERAAAAPLLASGAMAGVRVELLLAHSAAMLPEATIIDASRTRPTR